MTETLRHPLIGNIEEQQRDSTMATIQYYIHVSYEYRVLNWYTVESR